ncbi:hypothetical protein HanPI659440_Chr09g0333191 [Helianthus annuus]|nr:hypothetical protein HanPI659440_Chr09g0333191 [Helianthus annuus]
MGWVGSGRVMGQNGYGLKRFASRNSSRAETHVGPKPIAIRNPSSAETHVGPKPDPNRPRSDPKPASCRNPSRPETQFEPNPFRSKTVSCRNPSRADTCAGSKSIPTRNLPRFFKTLTHINPFI